jgi:hypothetical protein
VQKSIINILFIGSIMNSGVAQAGHYLVKGAKVVKLGAMMTVGNTYDNFGVHVEDALPGNVCPMNRWIKFPSTANGTSKEAYARVYSTLLLAFSTGARVNIYDYEGKAGCDNAMSVQIVEE